MYKAIMEIEGKKTKKKKTYEISTAATDAINNENRN